MEIQDILNLCTDDTIEITIHALIRCHNRGIEYSDIVSAIQRGEIIEDYPDDYPYPSCLIMGRTDKKGMLHIVAGIGENKLWIITAYFPSMDKWEPDFKTRKAVQK